MSNYERTTFYAGVTADLARRVSEHRSGQGSAFVRKYNLRYLVYYEQHSSIYEAIRREKQVKNWHREWKINLIKSVNPEMRDLTEELF